MPKRFMDTKMWDEDWFISLQNEYKLLWYFINNDCNHAGIWKPNCKKIEFIIDCKIDLDSFMFKINEDMERIIHLSNGNYWLIDFVSFQTARKLNIKNNAHKGILRELAANGINYFDVPGIQSVNLEGIGEEEKLLISPKIDNNPTPNWPQLDPNLIPKEKEKEKETYKEKDQLVIKEKKDIEPHKWDGVAQTLFSDCKGYNDLDDGRKKLIEDYYIKGDKVPF